MRSHTHDIKPALAVPVPDSLYRLVFVGGPFDGHEAQSAFLPDEFFQLGSGVATRNREAQPPGTPRLVQYRLTKSKLAMCSHEPIVLCRFEYCGTVPSSLPNRRWWRRCLPVSWQ